jgi:4-carboxymuconolactone decarboxylase
LQQEVVGRDAVDAMYSAAASDEAHFHGYLSANCFCDYLARPGLNVQTPELVRFSMLIALGGCEPRVRGHVAANPNVGNSRTEWLAVVSHVLPVIGYPRSLNALAVVNAVAPAHTTESPAHHTKEK